MMNTSSYKFPLYILYIVLSFGSIQITDLKVGSYNCNEFNESKVPFIQDLLSKCDILLPQET